MLLFAVLLGTLAPALSGATAASAATTPGGERDPLRQPYASTSIWNTPIGSQARYVPTPVRARGFAVHTDWFVVTRTTDPLERTYLPSAGADPCSGRTPPRVPGPAQERRRVPRSLVILPREAAEGSRPGPGAASAFLQPDGRTLVSYGSTARCLPGGPLYARWAGRSSLYGDGLTGGEAGSGMSSIGGSLRAGELLGPDPVRHALKLRLPARYLFHDGETDGWRWPARGADDGASLRYGGKARALRTGALLALPPDATPAGLRVQTTAGRALLAALRDHGAYVVGESGTTVPTLAVERRAVVEYREATGRAVDDDPVLQAEMRRMLAAVAVVDDNTPTSIGGEGDRRAEPPPPLPTEAGRTPPTATASPVAAPPPAPIAAAPPSGQGEQLATSAVVAVLTSAVALLAAGIALGHRFTAGPAVKARPRTRV